MKSRAHAGVLVNDAVPACPLALMLLLGLVSCAEWHRKGGTACPHPKVQTLLGGQCPRSTIQWCCMCIACLY